MSGYADVVSGSIVASNPAVLQRYGVPDEVSTSWNSATSASAETMAVRMPGRGEPVPLSGLNLERSRGQVVLQPLTMEFSPGNELAVSGTWQPGRAPFTYRVRWQSESVDLSSLEQVAAAFGWRLYQPDRWEGQAALDLVGSGDARNGWAVRWRGRLELSEAKFYPPEFNQALSIPQAHLLWSRRGLRVDPLVLQLGEDQIIATLQRPAVVPGCCR